MSVTTKENRSTLPPAHPEQPRSRWAIIPKALVYSSVVGLLGLVAWGMVNARSGPLESGMAPNFTLTSFDGETITLGDLRGQVVIVNFWASWCPPCREEAPYLERTWQAYRQRGVVFIGVDYADTEREALAYLAEFGITYFNGPDVGTRIAQAFSLQGVPETFFIAKSGELRGAHIGPLHPPTLDEKIQELLAEPYP